MKTILKTKIAFLAAVTAVLFSCKGNENDTQQNNTVNGSEIQTDSTATTTTEDNFDTDGTTVAPAESNTNSGAGTSSKKPDPSTIGPSSEDSGATGSGKTDGSGQGK